MTDATLNNIKLDLETISDNFSKSIAKRHIPFSDQTYLTDMGLKERTIKFRCYFWDDTYEDHKKLLKLLWGETDFELNHPEYGLLKGKVENISVRDDEREDTAEIDLDFVVGKSQVPEAVSIDIEGETETLYASGIKEIEKDFRDKLIKETPLAAEIVDLELDSKLSTILEQMPSLLDLEARNYIKKLDGMLNTFATTTKDLQTPGDSLVKTVHFLPTIPGKIIGTMASTVDKYSSKFNTLQSAPDRFINSFSTEMSRFKSPDGKDIIPVSGGSTSADIQPVALPDTIAANSYQCVCALCASSCLGKIYAEDEELRTQRKQMEEVKAFDDLGRMQPIDSVEYPMNVREIESTLYTVRNINASALASNREISSIKLLSDRLLDHVSKIKLEREKIIRVELDNEMPLHLVCLKYGLPYQAAERIMLINRISHPNFTKGRIDIYES